MNNSIIRREPDGPLPDAKGESAEVVSFRLDVQSSDSYGFGLYSVKHGTEFTN